MRDRSGSGRCASASSTPWMRSYSSPRSRLSRCASGTAGDTTRACAVRRASGQVDVEGEAVLFGSGVYAKLPRDIPDRLALAVLDVAGAAPQVARLVKPGASVLVLGAGGKSGILCAAEARRAGGGSARVIGVESYATFAEDLRALEICDEVITADARDPVAVRAAVLAANAGPTPP